MEGIWIVGPFGLVGMLGVIWNWITNRPNLMIHWEPGRYVRMDQSFVYVSPHHKDKDGRQWLPGELTIYNLRERIEQMTAVCWKDDKRVQTHLWKIKPGINHLAFSDGCEHPAEPGILVGKRWFWASVGAPVNPPSPRRIRGWFI